MKEFELTDFSEISTEAVAKVFVVDADVAVRDYLHGILENAVPLESTSLVVTSAADQPAVVVLGPSCVDPGELVTVEQWSSNSKIDALLVAAELPLEIVSRIVRAGVSDVIAAPVDEGLLRATVTTAQRNLGGSRPTAKGSEVTDSLFNESVIDPNQMGQLISVFSTKGGAGKSVAAANLAVLLAESTTQQVVLVDGDLRFGDLEVMLGLQSSHTIVDAIKNIQDADPEYVRSLMTEYQSGLLVLPAPREPTYADQVSADQFQHMLKLCRMIGAQVIIDLPVCFDENVIRTLEASDDVVILTGLDIPNIKNAKIGIRTLSMLGIGDERLHIVLNRADSKVKLDLGEVERTLGNQRTTHIPSDVLVPISVNKGTPVVLSAPKSGVARAYRELASVFVNNGQPVSVGGRRKLFG